MAVLCFELFLLNILHVVFSGIALCWGSVHTQGFTAVSLHFRNWLHHFAIKILIEVSSLKSWQCRCRPKVSEANYLIPNVFVQLGMWRYVAFRHSCQTGPSWLQLTLQRRQLPLTDKPSQFISRSRKWWTRFSLFGSDMKWISSSRVWKVNLFLPVNYGSASSHYANPDFRVALPASTYTVLFEFFKALCKHWLIN